MCSWRARYVLVARSLLARTGPLLLVLLDDLRRANLRLLRVLPCFAQGPALTQQIPTLIQLHLDLPEPLPIGLFQRSVLAMLVEPMFFRHQGLNVIEDRLILDLLVHVDASNECRVSRWTLALVHHQTKSSFKESGRYLNLPPGNLGVEEGDSVGRIPAS
jgi:hypothetical protein